MTDDELKKLRSYYHALLGQQKIFEDAAAGKDDDIAAYPVNLLADELRRMEAEFPGHIPPFTLADFLTKPWGGIAHYSIAGIRSYLASALGRLKVAIEDTQSTPVTQTREFSFVKDAKLRTILERDYFEIQRAFVAGCRKSVIILSGGAIEAILTDLLMQDTTRARAAASAPKEPDITRWDLSHLLSVSVALRLVSSGVERLSQPIRDYRNLVHPGNEVRTQLTFGQEEARIALEVLHIVHRDLSK